MSNFYFPQFTETGQNGQHPLHAQKLAGQVLKRLQGLVPIQPHFMMAMIVLGMLLGQKIVMRILVQVSIKNVNRVM